MASKAPASRCSANELKSKGDRHDRNSVGERLCLSTWLHITDRVLVVKCRNMVDTLFFPDQPVAMSSLAERAWFAYHCLPRGKRNKPPPYRQLEQQVGLTNGTFSRLFLGERERPEPETVVGIAKVLGVTLDWLLTGKGDGPKPVGIVPPRLPYLVEEPAESTLQVETLSAVSAAVRLIYEAAKRFPEASALELLAHAQLAAIRPMK